MPSLRPIHLSAEKLEELINQLQRGEPLSKEQSEQLVAEAKPENQKRSSAHDKLAAELNRSGSGLLKDSTLSDIAKVLFQRKTVELLIQQAWQKLIREAKEISYRITKAESKSSNSHRREELRRDKLAAKEILLRGTKGLASTKEELLKKIEALLEKQLDLTNKIYQLKNEKVAEIQKANPAAKKEDVEKTAVEFIAANAFSEKIKAMGGLAKPSTAKALTQLERETAPLMKQIEDVRKEIQTTQDEIATIDKEIANNRQEINTINSDKTLTSLRNSYPRPSFSLPTWIKRIIGKKEEEENTSSYSVGRSGSSKA